MIVTEPLVYTDDTGTYEGTVSWDNTHFSPRPAVLIAPTYKGQSGFETQKARQLAAFGYVGFAIDIYGQGVRASSPDEAQKLMEGLDNDRELLRSRLNLALQTARNLPQVDGNHIAAVGFCFGGKCILDLARTGANIQAAITFHGIYDPPSYPTADKIHPAILVLHGWEDPLSPPEQAKALAEELTQHNADWQIHMFGHTGHAFTNPQASDHDGGLYYQPYSDTRSWKLATNFLQDHLP